jgi:hypothetical protein
MKYIAGGVAAIKKIDARNVAVERVFGLPVARFMRWSLSDAFMPVDRASPLFLTGVGRTSEARISTQ